MKLIRLLLSDSVLICSNIFAAGMAEIEGGSYRLFYLEKEASFIKVRSFQLDKYLITNAEFVEFLKIHPQRQKDKTSSKQAEKAYLKRWVKNDSNSYTPKTSELKHPVISVSWFIASAYCISRGKRLPTIDEWELAGLALTTQKNGSAESGYNRTILDWCIDDGRNDLYDIGKNEPNYWDIYNMHSLVWEWTESFNSSQFSAGSSNTQMFCSGASVGLNNPPSYAAFLCYGIRASLQSRYVLNNLGFRYASE